MAKQIPQELTQVFADLPDDFLGHIEVHFSKGQPGFLKINRTLHIKSPATKAGVSNEQSFPRK